MAPATRPSFPRQARGKSLQRHSWQRLAGPPAPPARLGSEGGSRRQGTRPQGPAGPAYAAGARLRQTLALLGPRAALFAGSEPREKQPARRALAPHPLPPSPHLLHGHALTQPEPSQPRPRRATTPPRTLRARCWTSWTCTAASPASRRYRIAAKGLRAPRAQRGGGAPVKAVCCACALPSEQRELAARGSGQASLLLPPSPVRHRLHAACVLPAPTLPPPPFLGAVAPTLLPRAPPPHPTPRRQAPGPWQGGPAQAAGVAIGTPAWTQAGLDARNSELAGAPGCPGMQHRQHARALCATPASPPLQYRPCTTHAPPLPLLLHMPSLCT